MFILFDGNTHALLHVLLDWIWDTLLIHVRNIPHIPSRVIQKFHHWLHDVHELHNLKVCQSIVHQVLISVECIFLVTRFCMLFYLFIWNWKENYGQFFIIQETSIGSKLAKHRMNLCRDSWTQTGSMGWKHERLCSNLLSFNMKMNITVLITKK